MTSRMDDFDDFEDWDIPLPSKKSRGGPKKPVRLPNALESIDYWRLCDSLSIVQAALLVVGHDPSQNESVERNTMSYRPIGYEAAKTAITNALGKGAVLGKVIPCYEYDTNGLRHGEIVDSVDIHSSMVDVESLKNWLRSRGFTTGFFFPEPLETTDYLDANHPKYAPKLAAAIRAWEATELDGSRSAKNRLMKWLRENASDYGLTDDDGSPYESAIEEIAKVANWAQGGGAPKTPS